MWEKKKKKSCLRIKTNITNIIFCFDNLCMKELNSAACLKQLTCNSFSVSPDLDRSSVRIKFR